MNSIEPLSPHLWRPPTGTWPPPAPPFPRPPDFFSWFFWLNQNYEDARQAKEFFKRILADLLQDDPTLLASAQAQVGVTDGSDAQPGMVGEYVRLETGTDFPGAQTTQLVSAGVLPPGDWDCWFFGAFSTSMAWYQISLTPRPAGFADELQQGFSGSGEIVTIESSIVRALTTAPSLIAFSIGTQSVGPPGSLALVFNARRRR